MQGIFPFSGLYCIILIPAAALLFRVLKKAKRAGSLLLILLLAALFVSIPYALGGQFLVQENPSPPAVSGETSFRDPSTDPAKGNPRLSASKDELTPSQIGARDALSGRICFVICCIWLAASCILLLYSLISFCICTKPTGFHRWALRFKRSDQ